MKMVHTLVALVLLAIAGVPCSAIPREDMLDFGTVQAGGRGGGWNMLNQPVHFFGLSVGFSQVTVDGSVRLYTLDWDGPFQFAGELLASIPHSQEEDYTAYFWQVGRKDVIVLGKLARIVRNTVAGQAYKNFIPDYAAIWSWTRNSTSAGTLQAILVAQGTTTFLITSYCSDDEPSGGVSSRFAVADGEGHVVVFRERSTAAVVQPLLLQGQQETARDGQYVLRFDSLRCFNQDQFYCLTGQPKNFTTTNVASRSATVSFMETFDVGLITLESPAINYNISCMDAHGSTVLNASLNDTKETKFVTLYDLLPFTEYTCRLVKVVSPATPNATVINPVNLRFRTAEAVPEVAPSEVTVTANSTSAKVTWSPLPPKFQCGVITYNLRVISENLEVHTARVRNHSYQFLTLQPGTLYSLTIRASTEAGEGPATSEQLFITSAVHSTETPPEPTTTPASSVTTSTIEQHSATELASPSHPTSATDKTTPSTSGSTHESTTTGHHTSDPTSTIEEHSATELASPSHPTSATDETTPSTSGSTHESTTTGHHTSDPTSTIEEHSATELASPSHPTSATDETTPSTSGSTHESTTAGHHTSDPTTDVDNNVNSIDSLRVATDGEPFIMPIAAIAAIALGGALLVTIVGILVVCVCVCVYNCRRKRKTYVVNRTISQVPSATNRIFV